MKANTEIKQETMSLEETLELGSKLGALLVGDEVIELVSDLGGGKTAFVRGLARGIDSQDQVMSPTFTISRIYRGKDVDLHHFDFYRLTDPGVMSAELAESIEDERVTVAIEWSGVVEGVLPVDRLQVELVATGENSRRIYLRGYGPKSDRIIEELS